MFESPNRRLSRTTLHNAHRYLVCRTLRKCSAGVYRRPHSWFSRDGRSDVEEPDQETLRDHKPAASRVGLQAGLEPPWAGLFSNVRLFARPVAREFAAA